MGGLLSVWCVLLLRTMSADESRPQWMIIPMRRRLSPDAPRRVEMRRLRMCDVIRLIKDDVAVTHSSASSRLMMVPCFGAGWLRRPSTEPGANLLNNAVIEPWSLRSWRTLLNIVKEGQYRLSTFVSVKISHFPPWTTINKSFLSTVNVHVIIGRLQRADFFCRWIVWRACCCAWAWLYNL